MPTNPDHRQERRHDGMCTTTAAYRLTALDTLPARTGLVRMDPNTGTEITG
ncbi:hypothetical protein ACFQ6S_15770 [Streptomyces sp. NPDC056479]|uniref:hypothetical protein n=1 Tax=Streptomyces sp. NPDC056479 TaxID=3345832 RepID=UPI00369AECC6